MGVRNYLVDGVSCAGKSSVCRELRRRGFRAVDGDRELAYQGDPVTGEPTDTVGHDHHVWDVAAVESLVADRSAEMTFFCGGSRNSARFVHLFDVVFVLDVDLDTLTRRLDRRPDDDWGSQPWERDLVLRLHRTRDRDGVVIDATEPLDRVVDAILRRAGWPATPPPG